MNDTIQFLQSRNSSPRLTEPAPSESELEQLLRAALRAPDHAWLRPWRFIHISGERRTAFGEVLERSLCERNPQVDEAARTKARNAPLRAPLITVVVAKLTEHPKVPAVEQRLSAGCAAQALLFAAEASGYAGMWRTGDAAYDPSVMTALGLAPNEEIVAFLYLGTRDGAAKSLPALEPAEFASSW
ncbi:MAG: nitroreductase family protein [Pseudomonadota bacterium]